MRVVWEGGRQKQVLKHFLSLAYSLREGERARQMMKAGSLSNPYTKGYVMQITRFLLVVMITAACLAVADSAATGTTGQTRCATGEFKAFTDCPTATSAQTPHSRSEFVFNEHSNFKSTILICDGLLLVALTGVGLKGAVLENHLMIVMNGEKTGLPSEIGKRLNKCYGGGIGARMRDKHSDGGSIPNEHLTSRHVCRAGGQC